tara:strand:- start:5516 stop:6247 length:732 start_codon:yes stop_codon:yes gene_type:complete
MVHKIHKMKDKTDKFTTKKSGIFDLPMRLLIIGKTGCGKSGTLGNLFLKPDFYRGDFLPENIFIFSGSLEGDEKLQIIIKQLDIPESNIFDTYDEEIGHMIYDMLKDNYNDKVNSKEKPENSVIIFDDLGFANLQNRRNKNSIMDRLMSNGRKFLISTITLNQRVTQLNRTAREQASGVIIYSQSNKDLELAEKDFNVLENSKKFKKMFRENTEGKHDFLVINNSNGKDLYQNMDFKNIDTTD